MRCAYCERPLICEACRAPYEPPTPEAYEALSMGEATLECPACGEVLICHWCQTPYAEPGGSATAANP